MLHMRCVQCIVLWYLRRNVDTAMAKATSNKYYYYYVFSFVVVWWTQHVTLQCAHLHGHAKKRSVAVCVFVLVWVEYVVYGAYITATDRIAFFLFYVVCNFCSDSGMYLFRTWLQFLDRMQCIQPSQEETIFLCVSVLYIYIYAFDITQAKYPWSQTCRIFLHPQRMDELLGTRFGAL